ncbi:xanthosine phosphorylase [Candidatus Tokpelaia sp.]|uniref:xanthosine phosphorylase n=1 Tax=Candidatus Tokpelaia sp. TaxID=2233777 RepID=UPI00123B2622|nr:xanthosine phosphorylase [Candidatus Tokpelaia sp.]KAA6405957.1 purine-nucleoside phosphorylase [Candidatus Tokpelaia sp.]
MEKNSAFQAAGYIQAVLRQNLPDFKPRAACILGSGLGRLADKLTDKVTIPYQDLAAFPISSVEGHAGELVAGRLAGVPVLCMKGRGHFYEGRGIGIMTAAIRTFKLLGCDFVFVTAAAGSLHKEIAPGSLVAISDHINLLPQSPLVGANDAAFGPRFFSMANAYNADLCSLLRQALVKNGVEPAQGVYVAWSGPNFETAAEIRMMQIIGGDIVGMSVVPEVIAARHCGLKVVAAAVITNYAEGLSDTALSHEQTLHCAAQAADKFVQVMTGFFAELAEPPAG